MIPRMFRIRILPLYVLREFSKTFALSGLVVLIVLFISFSFKEVMSQQGLDFASVFSLFPLLIGKVLPYGLPFAVVCACTLSFGRLAGDNEISAMRCSGVHIMYIITPILIVALIASLITFEINDMLSPMLKQHTNNIKRHILKNITTHFASLGTPTMVIPIGEEKIFLYVDNIYDDKLHGVNIDFTKNGEIYQTITARSGRLIFHEDKQQLALVIDSGSITQIDPKHPDAINTVPIQLMGEKSTYFPISLKNFADTDISEPEMNSNAQLREQLKEYGEKKQSLEQRVKTCAPADRAKAEKKLKAVNKDIKEFELVMYGRLASSMSCFFLAWLVVPLSIAIKRGQMVVAFLVGLLVVVGYLVMLIVGSKFLGMGGILPTSLAMWLPNILLVIAGSFLMIKVINK